jgi:hypothetical protein
MVKNEGEEEISHPFVLTKEFCLIFGGCLSHLTFPKATGF